MELDPDLLLSAGYVAFERTHQDLFHKGLRWSAGRIKKSFGADRAVGFFGERMAEVPEFIRRIAAIQPTTPILDMGCCDSFMPLHYLAMGYEVHGIDLRDPELPVAGFRYIPGDAAKVQLDRQYQVCTLLSSLEHCGFTVYGLDPASTDKTVISNLRRFLTPDGRFICSLPYGRYAELGWIRVYDQARLQDVFGVIENPTYYRFDGQTWYPCAEPDVRDRVTKAWPIQALVVFESPAQVP